MFRVILFFIIMKIVFIHKTLNVPIMFVIHMKNIFVNKNDFTIFINYLI